MMQYALVINHITKIARTASLVLALGGIGVTAPAKAAIDISTLGGQSIMAEQGAICASFAALMENQTLINEDLGNLWSERRKFSGAVIRRAVELTALPSPSSDEIDLLINDYREWLILNLSSQDESLPSNDYQSDVQDLIKTNCKSLYAQADKAILKRYPDLAYLIDKQISADNDKNNEQLTAQIDSLMRKNNELNLKVIALRAEMAALKTKQEKMEKTPATKSAKDEGEDKVVEKRATPVPKPPKPRPVTKDITPKEKPANKADKQGLFFAQLGSFSQEASAKAAQINFQEQYPDLFDKITLEIQPHLFASGKTFYRLQTMRAERAIVTSICDELWDARMACLIKTVID